jgi:polysaccharide biosynthesis protein PslH
MNILFFAKRFPLPMDTGGKIRTGRMLVELNQTDSVTLVCHVERPQDEPYLKEVDRLCQNFFPIPWKEVPKFSFRFYWKCFAGMFSPYPITVLHDYDPALQSALQNILQANAFDIVICDFLQPSLNLKGLEGPPMILFQHNVESEIPYRHYVYASWNLKWFWQNQWKKMEQFEASTCRDFSGVITVSERDRRLLMDRSQNSHIYSIPTGVDLEYFCPAGNVMEEQDLVFTGSLDWLPNEDAILYFVADILPILKRERRGLICTIVGRNPSPMFLERMRDIPEIRVVGWVADVRPYVHKHQIFFLPLRIGGGTRIKVYEAMAMGKAVVSTSVGVEGLPVIHNENVMVADTPEGFATAILELLENQTKRKALGRSARRFVLQEGGWKKAGAVFREICQTIISSSRKPSE